MPNLNNSQPAPSPACTLGTLQSPMSHGPGESNSTEETPQSTGWRPRAAEGLNPWDPWCGLEMGLSICRFWKLEVSLRIIIFSPKMVIDGCIPWRSIGLSWANYHPFPACWPINSNPFTKLGNHVHVLSQVWLWKRLAYETGSSFSPWSCLLAGLLQTPKEPFLTIFSP